MTTFPVKDWRGYPDMSTLVTDDALEDLERRVTAGRRTNVAWYGASPAASAAANTAAIQAAYTAAHVNGGVVFYGEPGIYNVNDEITFWANTSTKALGEEITRVKWNTDLGAGNKFGFKCGDPINDPVPAIFEDIGVVGPVTDDVLPGNVGALMHGIDVRSRMKFNRVNVEGFWAGYHVKKDHIGWRDCDAGANFFNVYYADSTFENATFGDHSYDGCDFSAAWMASFGFHPSNGMDGNNIKGLQVGDAPYAFLREAGTPTRPFLINTDFTDMNAEGMGNAFIRGPNTAGEGDQVKGCHFNVFGITMDPNTDPETGGSKIAGSTVTEQIRCGSFQNNKFYGSGIFSDNPLPTECFIRVVGADASVSGNDFTFLGSSVIDNLSGSRAFIRAAQVGPGNKFDTGNCSGVIVACSNNLAVNQVVGRRGANCGAYAAGDPAMGVAMSDFTASDNALVLIANKGLRGVRVLTAVASRQLAYPDQANLGYGAGVAATSWATAAAPPFGVWDSSGSSGAQTCYLTVG